MKSRNSAVVATIAVVLLLAAVSIATPENAFAYEKNQAAFQTSACGNDFFPINIGCQDTNSQIQGDENAVALTAQQTFPEVELVQEEPLPPPSQDLAHILWHDNTPGNFEILSTVSVFPNPTTDLSNNDGESQAPAIAVSGSSVYAVWQDDSSGNFEILYRRSTDGGNTFESTINLSNSAGFSGIPAIAAFGDNVYVVWEESLSGNREILYRRSTDGGATFGSTINLSNSADSSQSVSIAASGNNVHVIWFDSTIGVGNEGEILYSRSMDEGITFEDAINLIHNDGGSGSQVITASENNVYIVWSDKSSGNNEILFVTSTDGGHTFGNAINLSNNAGFSEAPAIAVSKMP